MLVDSHCHLDQLDLATWDGSLDTVLLQAQQLGVGYFLCVGITLEKAASVLALAAQYPLISASVGLHPSEPVAQEPSVDDLIAHAQAAKVVAIGETGLDYYRCSGDMAWQQNRFRHHIRAAKAVNKPLIIHTRQASADTLRILAEEDAHQVGGVIHCFTESLEFALKAIELNFYISFSGIITFKNAVELQTIAKILPLDRLLVETDAPYLAPQPFRGHQNQPAYVYYVAQALARLKDIEFDTVAKVTTDNFFTLFSACKRP